MKIDRLIVMVGILLAAFQLQAAEPPPPPPDIYTNIPGSELWREVRQRDAVIRGTTQVKSTDSDILINVSGESWRQYRMQKLVPATGLAIMIVLIAIAVFRLLRGRIKIPGGRSGIKILRFTTSQRVAHWATTILFLILGLTGLILLLGRKFLIPVFGADGFSAIAVGAKFLHDYLGPLFLFALTWMFVLYVRDNLPSPRVDLKWFLKGGGLVGGHASAGRFNAGEKLWFWIASIGGLAVIISGLVLDFPIFGQTRATMEFYHLVHSVTAVGLIVISCGHIYMGAGAYEGAYETMRTGYCDANWARAHHDMWYEKVSGAVSSAPPEVEAQSPRQQESGKSA